MASFGRRGGIGTGRSLDADVEELEEEAAVDIAANDSVGFDNLLDVVLDKVIVGVNVLFDQA